MVEREVVLDQPQVIDEQSEALRHAIERADQAEAELAKIKQGATASNRKDVAPVASQGVDDENPEDSPISSISDEFEDIAGEAELRKDSMMAHLLDSLNDGKDIGHYGRLVFAMVARHFMPHEKVHTYLKKDRDFSEEQADLMLKQVEGRDYNPPKRERILEWQGGQAFPILPNPEDPDCGNLYRNLKFPDAVYDHISHYQEQKLESGS